MDKFDKILKDAVEGYEAPYDAQAWANVSAQLGNKGGAMKWIVGSAAAVVLISGTVYLMQQDETTAPEKITAVNTVTGDNSTTDAELTADQNTTTNTTTTDNTTDNNQTLNQMTVSEPADLDLIDEIVNSNDPHSNGNSAGNHQSNNGNSTENTVATNNDNNQVSNPENVVSQRVNSKFNSETTVACMSGEFIFTPEDINQNALYVWDFGDGTFSSSKVGIHSFKRAGSFTVSLLLKDSKTNKTLSKSSIDVTVNPIPEVAFAYEKSNEMIPTVTFINLTEGAENWNWDIKGLKTSSENQFEYTFRKKGTYYVELSATNEFGCSGQSQQSIEVKSDYNLLAPTAFTPNGDNKNDNFIPEALRIMDANFTMVVYDKAGTLMYQTNNVNQPWDGTNINDNSPAEDGAYVWQVQFKNANGETEYYEGQVIITR